MKRGLAQLAASVMLTASLLGVQGDAGALPLTLRLSDGTNSVEIEDGGPGDASSASGAVAFSGALGAFIVNVTTGLSYPLAGAPHRPEMLLNSVNVSASGPGTLTISLSHNDFMTTGEVRAFSSIDGEVSTSLLANISYDTFLGADNALFSLGTQLADLDFTGGAFAGDASLGLTSPALAYSLTQIVTISLPSGLNIVSLDAVLQVPEPTTLLLIALALSGLGLGSLRRAQAG